MERATKGKIVCIFTKNNFEVSVSHDVTYRDRDRDRDRDRVEKGG